jgi:hypothetical protein
MPPERARRPLVRRRTRNGADATFKFLCLPGCTRRRGGIRPRGPLEKSRYRSISRDDSGSRDTHDTIATPNRNVRNGAEKFRTFRSRAHHEIRDFKRCLVIGY